MKIESTAQTPACPSCPARDMLTGILRDGAQRLLTHAIEAEVADFIDSRLHLLDADGHREVVRNGHLPPRSIVTSIGPGDVRQPRVRDRRPPDEAEQFSSRILPPYLRRTKSIEKLIPWLYLKGVSTSDFPEALAALVGADARGLSATTVTRLVESWQDAHRAWRTRSLSGTQYASVWADGVHFNNRPQEDRQCILVRMGATPEGRKELIAIADGHRESEESWKALLLHAKSHGLVVDPKLATGDGALGFWKALPQAKCMLHEIYMAHTREDANGAFDLFVETHGAKSPGATSCLEKDRAALMAFYDFPAEHWLHVRTTNPIESVFATVRLRTVKTKGSEGRVACLAMV